MNIPQQLSMASPRDLLSWGRKRCITPVVYFWLDAGNSISVRDTGP